MKVSPLQTIYEGLAEQYGVVPPEFIPGRTEFNIAARFPAETFPGQPEVQYSTSLFWDKKTSYIKVNTTPLDCEPLDDWEEAQEFFIELTRNVKVYFDGGWPGGLLWPFPLVENPKKFIPGHKSVIVWKGENKDLLMKAFSRVHMCASHSLLLAKPVFRCIAEGSIPESTEQLDMLTEELERYEKLADSSNQESDAPPSFGLK